MNVSRINAALQCRSFMGIMPEINRIWITIDNRLYLWNYESNGEDAIITFEDQDQIIVSVGLAKPIPGVFLDQIAYVLVITTPLEIILCGLAWTDEQAKRAKGALTLYRTGMSVSSDGVNMTDVLGTDNGRIFMRGNNGQLYELVYQAQDGWLTRKIRKINHSSTGFSLLVPEFLKWDSDGLIRLMAVDNSKRMLYAVTKTNQISLYYLGDDGHGFSCVSTLSDILSRALRLGENLPQTPLDERNFQIVSIHAISQVESTIINLVAVAATGHRFYFSHTSDMDRFSSSQQLSSLRLCFVRPPPLFSGELQYNSVQSSKIHMAAYTNGLTIACQAFSEQVDRVIAISLDSGAISSARVRYLAETSSTIDIEGKTWSVVEAQTPQVLAMNSSTEQSGYYMNELVTQFEFPHRKFHLLTNGGLTTICKLRPLDILVQLIESSAQQDTRYFQDFFQAFGTDQACAMSLAIACGHSSISGGSYGIPIQVSTMAAKLYFDMGGVPAMNRGAAMSSAVAPLGVATTTAQVIFSSKHNGLSLYLSRLIRAVWKKEIVKKSSEPMLTPAISIDSFVTVQMNLQLLDRFLKGYPRFTAPPTPDTRPSNIEAEAWKVEQQSFANMHGLLIQSVEAISFLSMIMDYSLPKIASKYFLV